MTTKKVFITQKCSDREEYEQKRLEHFKKVEGSKGRVYTDSEGIPTLGIGYALLDRNGKGIYSIHNGWLADIKKSTGVTVTDAQKAFANRMLRKIRDILNGSGSVAEKRENKWKMDWKKEEEEKCKAKWEKNYKDDWETKWKKGETDLKEKWQKKEWPACKKEWEKEWNSRNRGGSAEKRAEAWLKVRGAKWREEWKKARDAKREAALKKKLNAVCAKAWQKELAKKRVQEARSIIKPPHSDENAIKLPLLSDTQIEKLFNYVADRKEGKLKRKINTEIDRKLVKELGLSREFLALLSLYYNLPGLIGPGLKAALKNRHRPKAWYQIRHNSNGGKDYGIAKRRYYEASLFGLYDDDNNKDVTEKEGKKVLAMYDLLKDIKKENCNAIDKYEEKFEKMIAKANNHYRLTKTEDVVLSIDESLAPAKKAVKPPTRPHLGNVFGTSAVHIQKFH
jgi:GH24 family phage-related lysozyme (muramidase)